MDNFEICKKIAMNRKRIIRLWDDVDYIVKNGAESMTSTKFLCPAPDSLTIGQAVAIALNFPPWLSRNKKKLEKMEEGPEKEALQKEINSRTAALEMIKKLRDDSYTA
jgi:hypothetical protein